MARHCDLIQTSLPTEFGKFEAYVVRDTEHFVLVKGGDPRKIDGALLTRIHSECLTGDVFASLRCDCGPQLQASMQLISRRNGILIYLRQEGRGIGLEAKIRAYKLQQELGLDTVDANLALGLPVDARRYDVAAAVLKSFGIKKIRLLTNNPAKVLAMEEAGIAVELESMPVFKNTHNTKYLDAKCEKLGHCLPREINCSQSL